MDAMDNYARSQESARLLFLNWNQEEMIARCRLRADDRFLYLNFLGEPFRIDRATGSVEAPDRPAVFVEALSVYDYLCRESPLPGMSGRFLSANSLPGIPVSSPNAGTLSSPWARHLQAHLPALGAALGRIALAPFPQGDFACVFPVFDGFHAVFQFWEGDDEFPPDARFLWDENALGYLKFETLHYVMRCFQSRLNAILSEIEKNC